MDYTISPAIQLISPYGKNFERGEQNKGIFLAYVRLPNKPKTDIFKYPVVAKRIEATQSEFEDQLEAYTVLSLLKRGPYVYGWKKESEGLYTIFMRPLAGKFDIINPIKDPFIFEGLLAIDDVFVPEAIQVLTNKLGISFVIDLSSEGYYYRFIRGNKELWKNIRKLSASA